jgi:hypothetical protein
MKNTKCMHISSGIKFCSMASKAATSSSVASAAGGQKEEEKKEVSGVKLTAEEEAEFRGKLSECSVIRVSECVCVTANKNGLNWWVFFRLSVCMSTQKFLTWLIVMVAVLFQKRSWGHWYTGVCISAFSKILSVVSCVVRSTMAR